jgi:hypothetical protein
MDEVLSLRRMLTSRYSTIVCALALVVLPACEAGGEGNAVSTVPSDQFSSIPLRSGYRFSQLGSPRLLISDAATLTRLRTGLKRGDASAVRFQAMVDAQMQGAEIYGFQPWFAALLGQLTGNETYCQYAVQQTERFVLSEEVLISAGERATVANDSYLEVGPLIGNLSLVYDWCRPQMKTEQRARWSGYANQAVWNVWNYRLARWGSQSYPWTGWSIDNPSNNYYYSFLRATMMLGLATHGENIEAEAWLSKFRSEKVDGELVPIFKRDLAGGGSREGTGYGTAMKGLFDLYFWWKTSTGENIADLTPHALDSLDKFPHDIAPTLDRLAPTGDHARDSSAALFDYHREYMMILAQLYPSDAMSGIIKTLLGQSSVPKMVNGFELWLDFVYDLEGIKSQPLTRLPSARWSSGTGQFSMRSAWLPDATYANFICGPYTESHAHRDQGSFVFFKGDWLAYDANIDSHSGLLQDESAHNLVRFEMNGQPVQQVPGKSCIMSAVSDRSEYSYARAVVTPMYEGKQSSGVVKVERDFVFLKPATLVIVDRVQTSGLGVRRIWSLNLPALPSTSGDRLGMTTSAGHRLNVTRLAPVGLPWRVTEWPAFSRDLQGGYRADAVDADGDNSLFLHVLGADGAFIEAVRSDSAEQTGVAVTLADGRVVTLRFHDDGRGGSIEIRDAAGNTNLTNALPLTIHPPPRFAN